MSILTAAEGANVLRTSEDDPNLVDLLPLVDVSIQEATGRDWAADNPVHPVAKAAARMLLVQWHENPGMVGSEASLVYGLTYVLEQLQVIALRLAAQA